MLIAAFFCCGLTPFVLVQHKICTYQMNLRDVIHTCRCISLFLFMCGKAAEVNKLLKRVSATQVKAIREAWLYCTSVCCDSSMDEIMRGDKGLKWATLPLLLWVLINWLLLFTLLFVGYSQHLAINWKNKPWGVGMCLWFQSFMQSGACILHDENKGS